MIFIANVLVMNGGTTFLSRIVQERSRKGQKSAVLLLTELFDKDLYDSIRSNAEIIHLSDYMPRPFNMSKGISRVFIPFFRSRLLKRFQKYGNHIHAMGIFGMIFGLRMTAVEPNLRLTVGVYHQNEFLYKSENFYFPQKVLDTFDEIPGGNIIFFNESTRDNYERFYNGGRFKDSHILPIGINLDKPVSAASNRIRHKIVSIGNLFQYKAYNRHMISVVADLRDRFPHIIYDIYGVGPMEHELRTFAKDLGVADCVNFHGALDYSRLHEVVSTCDLFVGSGTALIEAAAVGRPAMIGIESIETPETYGYLSDARGFSYNENMPDVPKVSIASLVERLFSDDDHWQNVATLCAAKAQSFSIAVTAEGFDTAGTAAKPIPFMLPNRTVAHMAASAIAMRATELLGRSEPFGKRHNQSYQ